MKRKWKNIFAFYKSTLAINIAISIFPLLFSGISGFTVSMLTIGYAVSLAVKEVRFENNYIFYHNNGLSKITLWLWGFFINILSCVLLAILFILCKNIF